MPRFVPRALLILTLAALALAAPWPGEPAWGPVAWADDDGGDDGGGDDDGGDDDGGATSGAGAGRDDSGQRATGRARGGRAAGAGAAGARAAITPVFAAELVVRDLSDTDLLALLAEGYDLRQRLALPGGAGTLTRLGAPPGVDLEAARDRVRALPGVAAADLNHFYRPGQDARFRPAGMPPPGPCRHANCAAFALIDWPADRAGCSVSLPVGVIDTGVNPDHDQLQGARLEALRLADPSAPESGRAHGTGVVSLLVGQSDTRVAGLIPEAEVLAIDIFSRHGSDERADVLALVLALQTLTDRGVRLVNLSLSGPENAVLTDALTRLTAPDAPFGGLIAVAAAGNGGPDAPPAWPAAHPNVVAVTAVDGRGRLYAQAQRGGHVALAAPGVNLLTATAVRGARAQSGTSFAAPFVTAAVALILSQAPGMDLATLRARLGDGARDLGAGGADPLFGAGLVSASTLCP